MALCLTLLPATALATAANWATDAVSTLNGIYGSGVFSADDGTMKEKDAVDIVSAVKWPTTVSLSNNDTTDLSRGTACEVLADVFDLPIGSDPTASSTQYTGAITISGSTTTVDENGKTEIVTTLSAAAVEAAQESGTAGTVAVLAASDGTETVIKTTLTTGNGVAVTLSDGDTVKIVDNSKSFTDVPDSYWGAEAVAFAASRELFQGTSGTTFEPDTPMSRAMMLTALARFEGVDTAPGDTWYAASVGWAVENGISDGTNPDQVLTREQLALMLFRYVGEPAVSGDLSAFADASDTSAWASQAMAWAVENGLVNGVGGGLLDPQGTATRAQVAAILQRLITNQLV